MTGGGEDARGKSMCIKNSTSDALDFTGWQMRHLSGGFAGRIRGRSSATIPSKGRNPAMESSSLMSFMSQAENRLGEPFRKGQREIGERFINQTTQTAQLPTGLGKTRAAAIGYAILRQRNVANRVLYIVPLGGQAQQAAVEFPRDLSVMLGQKFKAHILGDTPIPALKEHRSGACEIFITTIQALVVANGGALKVLREMMGVGQWFIIIDEYHHYGDVDKAWTSKIQSLPRQAFLAMS